MKVLVCGHERFADWNFMRGQLFLLEAERGAITTLMQFGDGNVARYARAYAFEHDIATPGRPAGIVLKTWHYDWDRCGDNAYAHAYALVMASNRPDIVMVFGGEQGAHRPFVRTAREHGIETIEFSSEGHLAPRFEPAERAA